MTPAGVARSLALAHGLTRRERDLLRMVASGCRRTELAAALGVRPSSVKTHTKQILRKLGEANLADVAARILRILTEDAAQRFVAAAASRRDADAHAGQRD